MTELRLDGIRKSYGDVEVLKGISRQIPNGAFFTLLGPSGCGKTTLLRVVAGFVRPTAGSVHFASEDVTDVAPHRREIGMVFQDYALFPDKTVFENVAYGLRARGRPREEIKRKVGEYLERVGLGSLGDRSPTALSGGQRQRVALARALVIGPRVLLMDEPLSNLDAALRVQMRDVIRSLQIETRTTTIFVTHDQEEALAMSDQVAVMKNGRIDQCGAPDDVYRNPQTAYVAGFVGSSNLLPARPVGNGSGGPDRFDVNGTLVSGRKMSDAEDGRYLAVARPENLGIRGASGAPGEGELAGRIKSLQFQGYRTSYAVTLDGGGDVNVETFGELAVAPLARGDEVIISFNGNCLFVPEASR
ncbi:ABC transporter ATP-binding protein [Rhodobium gokarnense]|uniref:Iron(III) transport system ATP-binding protein n=1 Tax=Rhodobium gokarnense TaxID=364296 RepID=A0ABT3HBE4_9HYPH|nr:ABC transporter ATP-binding protein [Rhodobium gokarnense]MCW2307664.1 iron(III) transport system ATP-binding protein [Rhodobium gokarnense]